MSVVCDNCKHVFEGHTNFFGKVCTHCGQFIHPTTILPIIKENQMARLNLWREYLQKHPELINYLMEKYNANSD